MSDFMDRAKDAVDQHDKQVDEGLQKAGQAIDDKTGGQHGDQIQKGVDQAQQHTGQGDQA
jgi:hypothetical protein